MHLGRFHELVGRPRTRRTANSCNGAELVCLATWHTWAHQPYHSRWLHRQLRIHHKRIVALEDQQICVVEVVRWWIQKRQLQHPEVPDFFLVVNIELGIGKGLPHCWEELLLCSCQNLGLQAMMGGLLMISKFFHMRLFDTCVLLHKAWETGFNAEQMQARTIKVEHF